MSALRVLHLEDDELDAVLVRRQLEQSTLSIDLTQVASRPAYLDAIARQSWDVVIVDNGVPSFDSLDALKHLHQRHPDTPLVILSGAGEEAQVERAFQAGAADYIRKDYLWQVLVAIRRVSADRQPKTPPAE
jgi:CheY-like chemotaxis protein